ncbi:hypothetical protein BH10PLA2_BH10PLA2_29660 [soil metagenome]
MYTRLVKVLAIGLLLTGTGLASAQDDANKILDRAVQAHGGAAKLSQIKGQTSKAKGRLELQGGLDFTQESAVQHPDKLKEVIHLAVNGMNVDVITVYNGKEGWANVAGQTMPLEGATLDAIKDAIDTMALSRLAFMGGKDLQVALLGEAKVNDKAVVGVKIGRKGHKDVNMYFDKATGLLAKLEHRVKDPMSGQDVTEERIILDYQDVDGMKVAKKVIVNRDDKKYMEAEVLEVKFSDKLDDSLFGKP